MLSLWCAGVVKAAFCTPGCPSSPMLRAALWRRCRSYAKGFAVFGAIYSFNECIIENFRAKHDKWNPAMAGCATGAMLAHSGKSALAVASLDRSLTTIEGQVSPLTCLLAPLPAAQLGPRQCALAVRPSAPSAWQ